MSSASPTTPPSSAELAQLQQAFAADSLSDAYHPLAEAYLAMGRFMEAMVVCKKGVKAHPEKAAPHILMARIYAEQSKDKKAVEEIKLAIEQDGDNVEALRLAGELSFKAGNGAEGADFLSRAIARAPDDAELVALCRKHKVPLPQPPAPAPAPMAQQPLAAYPTPAAMPQQQMPMPQVAYPPQSAPPYASQPPAPGYPPPPQQQPGQGMVPYASQTPTPYPAPAAAQPAGLVPFQQPSMQPLPQSALAAPAMPEGLAEAPTITPRAQRMRQSAMRAQQDYAALAAKYSDPDEDVQVSSTKALRGVAVMAIGVVLVIVGLGAFYFVRQARAERETEIAKLLKQTQEELSHDNYASYKKACELGERITEDLDPDLFSAHAFLSYAYAIRWGEHGEGDRAKQPAHDHLAKAKAAQQDHSYLSAAEAYIQFFEGDTEKAIRELEQKITDQDARGQNSTLLLSTLGILQTHAGRLESALINLKKAQLAAPADSRISAWMGNALRRQGGNDVLAANAYEQALRYEKNHAEAQLGVALMAVDAGKPETAEKYIEMLIKADPPPSNRQLALARLAHAIILDGKGKKAEADNEEQKALASDPNNGELFIMKASRQKRASNVKGALESIRQAIKLEPSRTSFQIELADTLMSQPGGAQEASSSLEKLVAQSPNSLKLLVLLGKAQMETKAFDKADATLKKARDKAVKNEEKAEVFLEMGNLAAWQNRSDEALKNYTAAEKAATSSKRHRAQALVQMGRLYEKDGNADKAIESYANAQLADANHAPSFFLLGRLLLREKKSPEIALEQLQTYLKMAPGGEWAEMAKKLAASAK